MVMYTILSILVALNMLIAIMSQTYDRIRVSENCRVSLGNATFVSQPIRHHEMNEQATESDERKEHIHIFIHACVHTHVVETKYMHTYIYACMHTYLPT